MRNYRLYRLNGCRSSNFAAKAADCTNIRTHQQRSRKIHPTQFVKSVKSVVKKGILKSEILKY